MQSSSSKSDILGSSVDKLGDWDRLDWNYKVFGWNVTGPKLRKGRGGEGPLSWGGTTFRFAGARQKHNFEQAKQKHNFEHFIE